MTENERQIISPPPTLRQLSAPTHIRSCSRHLVSLLVGQALDLEQLGHLEELGQLLLGHVHLAVVHEVQQQLHVVLTDVSQDHDRMRVRVRLKQSAADGEVTRWCYDVELCNESPRLFSLKRKETI